MFLDSEDKKTLPLDVTKIIQSGALVTDFIFKCKI